MTPDDFEDLLARAIELFERGDQAGVQQLVAANPDCRERLAAALRDVAALGDLAPDRARPGERLGDFRLLQRLGGGGMGIVWLAEQESLRRKVALKVVRPELLASPVVRERFHRETEIVARLQHPGIVQVLAVGSEGPVRYLAMEYLPGCSLADVLHAVHDRDPRELARADFARAIGLDRAHDGAGTYAPWWSAVVACLAEVAETVAFVHAHGLIHRDLKPSNVIVTAQGRTKLLDFGLVHVAEDPGLTQSGVELGSPAYMSPEQLLGRAIDERSDVYSLAVTLRQLLALRLPFATDGEQRLRTAIVQGDSVRHWWRTCGCPRDLATVVDQAMDVDRDRRHATMAAFATDLRAVLDARPVSARSPSPMARFERWRRRRPFHAGALGVFALLVLLAPLPLWWWQRSHSHRLDQALSTAEGDLGEAEAAIRRMLEHAAALDLSRNPEAAPLRLQLMQDAVGFYDRMIARHPEQVRLQVAQAECCWRFGLELRVVGRRAEALAMFDRAESLHASLPSLHADVAVQRLLCLKSRAILLRETGERERSERTLDAMQSIATELLRQRPRQIDFLLQAAEIGNERSMLRHADGQLAEHVALQRVALAAKRDIAAAFPAEPIAAHSLAMQCTNLADALAAAGGDPEEQGRLYAEAEALLAASSPGRFEWFWEALSGDAWCGLGRTCRERGDLAAAEPHLLRAIEKQRALLRLAPKDSKRLRTLATACFELVRLRLDQRRPAAAAQHLAEGSAAVAILQSEVVGDSFTQALVAQQAEITTRLASAEGTANHR